MIEFHELAIAEARCAQAWYTERSRTAAMKFHSALEVAIANIDRSPTRFPVICDDFQYARVFGFPYIVVYYRKSENISFVVAVAHTSRQSDYWIDRT